KTIGGKRCDRSVACGLHVTDLQVEEWEARGMRLQSGSWVVARAVQTEKAIMALFNVSYDLIKDKDYSKVADGIDKLCPKWSRPLQSTWLVEHDGTSLELAKAVLQYMDGDDRILVTGVTKGTISWRGIPAKVIEWINNLARRAA